jgi:broad specificity phosphatase PhoE
LTFERITEVPFWYLRHGQTDWNAEGRSQGSIDIPLNATGIGQAQAAAQQLRNRGIATIVASPLSRARVTAEIVAETLGLPIQFEPDLKEVNWGVQEGQPASDWFDRWTNTDFAPEGAETFAQLRRRTTAGVNRALANTAPVLVVAHGAVFRTLRAAMGLDAHVRSRNAQPLWCAPGPNGWTIDEAVASTPPILHKT